MNEVPEQTVIWSGVHIESVHVPPKVTVVSPVMLPVASLISTNVPGPMVADAPLDGATNIIDCDAPIKKVFSLPPAMVIVSEGSSL